MRMAPPAAAICLFFLNPLNGAQAANLEHNKQLVRAVIEEVFNKHQPDAEDRYVAAGYVEHNPRLPQGLDGQKKFVARVLAAFNDYHADICGLIAEGDKVMVPIQWTGTRDGRYLGQPPSGRKVSFATADIFRIADGKLAEHWDVVDSLQRALALGEVVPVNPPGAPSPKTHWQTAIAEVSGLLRPAMRILSCPHSRTWMRGLLPKKHIPTSRHAGKSTPRSMFGRGQAIGRA